MPGPIGISFLPSEEQAANGPMQGNAEGDLGQALKILSLHLPRVLGARPIASNRLLTNPGGFNPMQAVIQALLQAGGFNPDGGGGASGGYGPTSTDPTRVTPGGGRVPTAPEPPMPVTPLPTWSAPVVDRSQGGGDGSAMPTLPRNPGGWRTY